MRKMTTKQAQFKISISDFDKAAWVRLKEARDLVSKIEKEISDAFQKSERFQAVRDLSGYGDHANKFSSFCRIEDSLIVSSTVVDLADEPAGTYVPPLNIGEKTLNALLTGKLLDDDQKKILLKRIGVDLEDLSLSSATSSTPEQ